jgi:apolipoprotein N-acyltransferase
MGPIPALAGLAAAAGQAPLGWWWLTLGALAVLIRLVALAPGRPARVWIGWCGGVGYFTGTLFWIVEPFLVDAAKDGWMAPFALLLMAGGMALFWGLAAVTAGLGRNPATRAIGFALGLVACDLLRSYLFTGFPWALLGHIWIATSLGQIAAFTGPIGLTALTAALALLPVLGVLIARPVLCTLGAIGLFAVVLGAGQMRLAAPDTVLADPVRLRLVQPDAEQALKWQPGMLDLFLDRQMQASAAPAEQPLDLIIWPETAIPYLLEDAGLILEEAIFNSGGVPLASGVQRAEGSLYFNSLIVTDAFGAVQSTYDKHHLVPFGEYFPFGDFVARFGITAFAAKYGRGYTPGPGAVVLDLGAAGKVLPLICYEAVFPQDLNAATDRADWILQITNDGWFGTQAGPYQHLAQARLRAIEQGLPLMRVANTGVTAAIDAKGRVTQDLALGEVGWLDVAVPAALAPTLYARTGDGLATILVMLSLLALALWRGKRSD